MSSQLMLMFTLAGCVYKLAPATMPNQVRVKVLGRPPQVYDLRLRIDKPQEYHVPADGRVTIDVPGYRVGCGPYLFGLELPGHWDPYTSKTITVLAGGKVVRQLSLKKLYALPLGGDGYYLLRPPHPK